MYEVWFWLVFGGVPLVLNIIVYTFLFRVLLEEKYVLRRGTLTRATVCQSEYDDTDFSGYACYIKYLDTKGNERITKTSLKDKLPVGRNIEIKYIDGNGEGDKIVVINNNLDDVAIPAMTA